ncbi:MAG: hypothetical protein M1833_006777 [Piccolia ochrophora]|nr:MAG: hypothetical protein M1833_006777 [Piccolia ochrophora]
MPPIPPKSNVLIVGATRGLGEFLTKQYASRDMNVFATSRSDTTPSPAGRNVQWIPSIDLSSPSAGPSLASALRSTPIHVLIVTAGYFGTESFDEPNFEDEENMYRISAIGPVFLVHHLEKAGCLKSGAKVILVSSESGSIALRHEKEGGGNYGHHASKAALNMVGKLLSLDLKEKGVAVGLVHPGFMRTEMTRSIGFDKFWDEGGAVTPDKAASSLIEFIETFDMSKTGQYWAPRGPGDIGTSDEVLGKDLPTPLQLPW